MTKTMRKIVHIDEDKCNGCGLCVPSCTEGAIRIVDGKARLAGEALCDGLGACLGECPQDAISIEERQAEAFDEQAVASHKAEAESPQARPDPLPCGCPGTMMRKLDPGNTASLGAAACESGGPPPDRPSRLGHWPVQLALLPERSDIWDGADVVLAADCVGFALPDFHERLLAPACPTEPGRGKTLAVACPKLDDADAQVAKLARILAGNEIRSVTIARMEVPCCGGLVKIFHQAMERAGKTVPLNVVTVSAGGRILDVSGVKVAV